MVESTTLWRLRPDGSREMARLLEPPVAVGGAGRIHRVDGDLDVVAKLYLEPEASARREKLEAMLATPPHLPDVRHRGARHVQISWPVGLLENGAGVLAGYVMPAVDLDAAAPLETLLSVKSRKAFGMPEDYGFRVTAAFNVASVVAELHRLGHHVIDLKPVNIHVYRGSFFVAMLDCDGFSILGKGGVRYPGHQYTDAYIAPEALQERMAPEQLGEAQDRFALAVIVFQLLNQGIHPYQGRPRSSGEPSATNNERVMAGQYAYGRKPSADVEPSPWSLHGFFDEETRSLFDRAFASRDIRPSAEEWRDHLEQYVDPKRGKLRVCRADPSHAHFERGCGLCALQQAHLGTDHPTQGRSVPPGARPWWVWKHGALRSRASVVGVVLMLLVGYDVWSRLAPPSRHLPARTSSPSRAKVPRLPPVPSPTSPPPAPAGTREGIEVPVADRAWIDTPSGLAYMDIRLGEGRSPVEPASLCRVQVTGWEWDGSRQGRELYTSRNVPVPVIMKLDDESWPPGLREGVATMKEGGLRRLLVPESLAKGKKVEDPAATRYDGPVLCEVALLRVTLPEPAP